MASANVEAAVGVDAGADAEEDDAAVDADDATAAPVCSWSRVGARALGSVLPSRSQARTASRFAEFADGVAVGTFVVVLVVVTSRSRSR